MKNLEGDKKSMRDWTGTVWVLEDRPGGREEETLSPFYRVFQHCQKR